MEPTFLHLLKHVIIKVLIGFILFFYVQTSFSQSLIQEPKVFKEQFKLTQNPILVDLRATELFNKGRIAKSISIPFENQDFEKAIAYISKETPVYLYCQNGEISQNAAVFMKDLAYKNVIVLRGGFENWVKVPLPYVGGGSKSEILAYYSLADIDNLAKKYPLLLLDFYATWCKPCKLQDPILKELNKNHPELKIIKLDADKNQTLAAHFEIEEIPTLILFKKSKQFWRKSGLVKSKQLEAIL